MSTGSIAERRASPGRLLSAAAGLFPGYFALVMATGIVSIACHMLGYPGLARPLLPVNLAFYAALVALTLLRLTVFPRRLLADLGDHARGSGFFTLVAATNVLGSQCLRVAGWRGAAEILFAAGVILWIFVMYAFFLGVVVRTEKPTLVQGINGAWLLATVSSQSVAVLGATLVEPFGWSATSTLFVCLGFYLIGCALYLAIITLIFYRFTFLELESANLTPPYWISMGAAAITTLAGATLLLAADRSPTIAELGPFLRGFTLLFWVAGSWWIPLLLLLGAWRHLLRRNPLVYDPQYWAMVFPLGMYAAATWRLSEALPMAPLAALARLTLPFALLAWAAALIGMVHSWTRSDKRG
jgi:tellurite resistance protein TehA-like permease